MQTLLEILIEESVHDGVGADRAHGGEVAAGKEHQHHFSVFLIVFKWLKYINDDVEDVERGPRHEEDDTDGDQHPVGLLPPLHLACSSVGGKVLICLRPKRVTHSGR